MDFSIIAILAKLLPVGPDIKKWIDIGLPIATELQKEHPDVISILENIGTGLFPELTDTVHKVAGAADAIFNPNGTKWLQKSLNDLQGAGLAVDGSYGPMTKAAVTAFQTAHQPLSGPIDGWAGQKTKAVIMTELSKRLPV